jgi:hypothetical protein
MVGRRWDLEIAEALHFTTAFKDTDWEAHLRTQVLHKARRRGPEWIDYFVFSRGLFGEKMPSFVGGRVFWDNWLVWRARAALFAEIRKWLHRSGPDLPSADLHAYMVQWKKEQERDGFALQAPGRRKYFRHLLGYPWTYREIMTPRHRVYGYMKACAALVLGYHHLHLFDDARRKRKEWMARSSEKNPVAIPAKARAAVATKS